MHTFLDTICHYDKDIEDELPEEGIKTFWFGLIPYNGKYKIANIFTS